MSLRRPTDEEALLIVYNSLITVWDFPVDPDDPAFEDEVIVWDDILALPPVTKAYLHTNTLVAAYLLIPGTDPRLNRNLFNRHLDTVASENVLSYRVFLQNALIISEDA